MSSYRLTVVPARRGCLAEGSPGAAPPPTANVLSSRWPPRPPPPNPPGGIPSDPDACERLTPPCEPPAPPMLYTADALRSPPVPAIDCCVSDGKEES